MKRSLVIFAGLLLVTGLVPTAARSGQIVEKRGSFFYDTEGQMAALPSVEPPQGFVRGVMSDKAKFAALGLELPDRPAVLKARYVAAKPASIVWHKGMRKDRVIVKFKDDVPVRLQGGNLMAMGLRLDPVHGILARYPEGTLGRAFTTPEDVLDADRDSGERLGGRRLADLNNFYVMQFPGSTDRAVDLVNELLPLANVETAYLESEAEPPCADVAPATPSYVGNQNYLGPAPGGVDANFAWAYHAGGDGWGPGYWVMDVEWQWCYGHEDLPIVAGDVVNGSTGNDANSMMHGTAVLGIYGACPNAYGVTGISNDVTLKMTDFDSAPTIAAAINTAAGWLFAGEIMLLEIHIYGTPSGLVCPCNCLQFEYVPVEWDAASFAAIQTATANGKIVVEAGGNGSMNLDSAIYGGWFNRLIQDSGAIMVGAGINATHVPECFTDYGSRIDVHGYGDALYTTGYGNLFNDGVTCQQDYTFSFGGTSGASPMIVGAAADLQGIAKLKYGVTLTPAQMRGALQVGGTPQGAPLAKNIGVMPNLANAIVGIQPDLAPYAPGGWDYPVVPRLTADATVGFAPLPAAALPGNVAGTIWNWTSVNWSLTTPTLDSPQHVVYVEDGARVICSTGNYPPFWFWACINYPPSGDVIRGGRHTVTMRADWTGVEAESNEGNNDFVRQFIWSPEVLGYNAPLTRSYDPVEYNSTWVGPWGNADGFEGSTGLYYMHAFAVMPVSSGDDFDITLNTETPLNIPQQGFGAYVAGSFGFSGVSDFVLLDRNRVGPGTYYASVLDFYGTGNKVVEFTQDHGTLTATGTYGPFTLGSGNIIDTHELFLYGGSGPYSIKVQVLSGGANVGVSVYPNSGGFFSKYPPAGGAWADNHGPGESETVIMSPPGNDWYPFAVWKVGSGDLYQSLTYNIIISQDPNLLAQTPPGWSGPVVPRNTTDATPGSAILPPTLTGNATTTSYNFSTLNEGATTASAAPYWTTRLYVDDVWYWSGFNFGLAASTQSLWLNTSQGLDPYSLVRGGRHYIRLDADNPASVVEFLESDNTFVDWFVWTPYDLLDQTPVTRSEPPNPYPTGYSFLAVDGFRATPAPLGPFGPYWSAVGILPVSGAADDDLLMYEASTGSKDGFGFTVPNGYSFYGTGVSDFVIANYNLVPLVARDYGVTKYSGGGNFVIQRADGYYMGVVTATPPFGTTTFGPFTIDANDVLNFHEVYIPPALVGLPLFIELDNLAGTANMGISLYSNATQFAGKPFYMAAAEFAGPGADEQIPAFVFPSAGFYGLAAYKSGSSDLPLSNDYRIRFSFNNQVSVDPLAGQPPAEFALGPATPNPSGGSLQLRYDIPSARGRATVAVYDLGGHRVKTLADGALSPGRYSITWDGLDEHGRRVSPGLYFIRLHGDDARVRASRKVTLLN